MSSEREQRSAPGQPGARATAAGPAPGKQTRSEQGAPRGPAESTGSGARSLMRPEEWVRAEPWLPGPGLLAAMGLDGLEHGDGTGAAGPTPHHQGTELAVPRPGRNQAGFIDHGDGANLRTGPAEAGGAKVVARPLPPATRVFVSGTHPSSPQWWYVTAFLDDEIVRGYVQDFRVTTDLPEPTAKLHQIKSGDTAEGLAVREFKSAVRDGHDLRYYENVLLKVNRDRGRAGITGSFQAPGLFGGGSNNIQLVAGRRIWLVSPAYARSLEGEVPDGSLSNGGYAKVKRFAGHITDILQSVTQSPRFFPEVAGELARAIADHMPLIIGVVAGFITLEAASALLAATPTGVGQIIAVLIQLLLAALGAQGMVEAGVQALRHGGRWLNLAWTAQGDEAKLATASKEFLKMLVAIAMAALAFAGAKANFGKALKISPSMPMPMPAMAIAGGGHVGNAGTAVAIGGPGPLSGVGPAGAMAVKHGDEGGTASSAPDNEAARHELLQIKELLKDGSLSAKEKNRLRVRRNELQEQTGSVQSAQGSPIMAPAPRANQANQANGVFPGKNFKQHFLDHHAEVEKALGIKLPRLKDGGGEALLSELEKGIQNGTFEFAGKGTLKKGDTPMNIYRGNGLTVVVKESGEWVTALKSGEGMDLAIRFEQ